MKSNRALFDAALSTVKQADSDRKNSVPKLVCSETGSGKTTFCTALIATWTIYAKNYSAAYVVATINEAQKVYDLISPLLPDGELSIYTSAHASIEAAQRIGDRVEEHVNTNGPSQKAALRKCRVVICTHELYFSEADTECDYGIRKYDGSPRTHVFLDEFPDTLHRRCWTNQLVTAVPLSPDTPILRPRSSGCREP